MTSSPRASTTSSRSARGTRISSRAVASVPGAGRRCGPVGTRDVPRAASPHSAETGTPQSWPCVRSATQPRMAEGALEPPVVPGPGGPPDRGPLPGRRGARPPDGGTCWRQVAVLSRYLGRRGRHPPSRPVVQNSSACALGSGADLKNLRWVQLHAESLELGHYAAECIARAPTRRLINGLRY